jgi:bifunctional non-homologous end joining protein LigD
LAIVAAHRTIPPSQHSGPTPFRFSKKPFTLPAMPSRQTTARAGFIEPMKARLVEHPLPGDWIYEVKLDGFRALAIKNAADVQLLSRNNKELGGKFPEVARAVAKIKARDFIIDGEIVALENTGRSSFQLLQAYDLGEARPPIIFYAFDLLRLNGKDFRREPLTVRKAALEKLLAKPPDCVRYSESLEGDVEILLEQARRLGLEGLIGKRKDSLYESGQRTGSWIKLKISHEQEFVIGGFSNPQGSRKFFGALLVGYFEKDKFLFAGKVGTGFNEISLRALHRELEKLRIPSCPFVNLPEKKGDRWSPGLTASEMKKCHWVQPKLVAQIRYTEWTRDAKLRHPVYLGLRQDKSAREVVRETPT